ncbi:hypothetical protein SMJ63A_30053 [Stenotrophomonas geniculata]
MNISSSQWMHPRDAADAQRPGQRRPAYFRTIAAKARKCYDITYYFGVTADRDRTPLQRLPRERDGCPPRSMTMALIPPFC